MVASWNALTLNQPSFNSNSRMASDWVSACIQKEGGTWVRRTTTSPGPDTIGYHLITESGTFRTKQGLFRDFTEVGADRIQDTYSFVASRLNFQS